MSVVITQNVLLGICETIFEDCSENILPFWRHKMIDNKYGGFLGGTDFNGAPMINAPKGLILNARILWTFSASCKILGNPIDLEIAHRAFNYIQQFFQDRIHGGYFWSLNPNGTVLDPKKQFYALAFVIYAFSEYYKVSANKEALIAAKQTFELIESKSFDADQNGYIEALTFDWREIGDLRLSEKDMNEKKTMNTHLHILEAYSSLFEIWKNPFLRLQLRNLVHLFLDKFISQTDYHLNLFFDDRWNNKSSIISYGHDIETGWLLYEASLKTGDNELIERSKHMVPLITGAALEGLAPGLGLYYEGDRNGQHIDKSFEWWPQAEAIVGLVNAYEVSGDVTFIEKAAQISNFIDQYFVDRQNGEWHARLSAELQPETDQGKTSFWKCPYHNCRAAFEIFTRIKELKRQNVS